MQTSGQTNEKNHKYAWYVRIIYLSSIGIFYQYYQQFNPDRFGDRRLIKYELNQFLALY